MAVLRCKRLLGIWDLRLSLLTIGGILIFLEELQMIRIQQGTSLADFCIVDNVVDEGTATDNAALQRYQEKSKLIRALLIPLSIQGIGDCYWFKNNNSLRIHLSLSSCDYHIWPESTDEDKLIHTYGDTTFTQSFFRQNGYIPYLSFAHEHQRWARKFIMDHVYPHLPIVLYLKNNPQMPGCSNANFEEWVLFIQAYRKYDVRFIIIGNDELDERLYILDNVIVARNYDSSLVRDLALVQAAFFFMGMSAGPAVIALYSDIPYIIFKNPEHDIAQMQHELGDREHFSFATPIQKLLRQNDNQDAIAKQFDYLYAKCSRKEWESRMLIGEV